MKLRLIYCLNITDTACCNEIYNMHYQMISKYINIFDEAIIIFNFFDEITDYDVVFRLRAKFIGLLNNVKIISYINAISKTTYNNNIEENIYKKYVISKLNEYDGLTFFMYNTFCGENNNDIILENKKQLICALYTLNLKYINEVKDKLNDYTDIYAFGAFYNKYINYHNKYKWHYIHGAHWLNTKKIYNYIVNNNIDINKYLNGEKYLSYDMFLGDIFNENQIAFHNDEFYNKSYVFQNKSFKSYFNPFEYEKFITDYNSITNEK